MKYIVVGYTSKIDLKTSTAEIAVLCGEGSSVFWERSTKKGVKLVAFKTRAEADQFIRDREIIGAVSYGVE